MVDKNSNASSATLAKTSPHPHLEQNINKRKAEESLPGQPADKQKRKNSSSLYSPQKTSEFSTLTRLLVQETDYLEINKRRFIDFTQTLAQLHSRYGAMHTMDVYDTALAPLGDWINDMSEQVHRMKMQLDQDEEALGQLMDLYRRGFHGLS
ncbi:hypothetical protein N7466_010636 [Penicillium verhagenii]|uniref:uncharacterized protein n=1 Tax=Penicillium verhagenii TaxID=1562060 RepID=UPI0025459032|nr:uncharacterized protein N7466_010636 [Penicillium verhagenii]KAJ5918644.1 hypothetical protein N7466_010636 [Penicillium verhagenii]